MDFHYLTTDLARSPAPAREVIAAMDFFTVPTLTFGVLYCFFVITHDGRSILYFNVTRHPTGAWVSQQLRQACPYDSAPRYLIHERDAAFNAEVVATAKVLGVNSVRTSFKSPWQNGVAERFVGSCRRDLLDHVIVLNERHLKRLMAEYVRHYHDDRTHLGLDKQTPGGRQTAKEHSVNRERGFDAATRRLASSVRARRLKCYSDSRPVTECPNSMRSAIHDCRGCPQSLSRRTAPALQSQQLCPASNLETPYRAPNGKRQLILHPAGNLARHRPHAPSTPNS